MKPTLPREALCHYRAWEDKIIAKICVRYWRPKRIGGSSIAKADVIIRQYFRIQLLCMVTFFSGIAGMRYDLNFDYLV